MPNSDWAESAPSDNFERREAGMKPKTGNGPLIFDALQEQYDLICKLRELVDMLESKFMPVLGPSSPDGAMKDAQDYPSRSDLAAKIEDHTDNLKRIEYQVTSMLRRVEL